MTSLGSFVANTGPWPGAVLLDTAKAFFTALGAREMDMSFAGSAAGKADLRASYKRAKIAGFTGDLEGEGMLRPRRGQRRPRGAGAARGEVGRQGGSSGGAGGGAGPGGGACGAVGGTLASRMEGERGCKLKSLCLSCAFRYDAPQPTSNKKLAAAPRAETEAASAAKTKTKTQHE